MRLRSALVFIPWIISCGAGGGLSSPPTPRTAPPLDLIALAPAGTDVVLHADLDAVRTSQRYDWFANELASELGMNAEAPTVRALLDRTNEALGVMLPASSGQNQEGALIFSGQFGPGDFDQALALGRARHGGAGEESSGPDGRRIIVLGDAAMISFDQWTFALVQGPQMRAHLSQVPLRGAPAFRHQLIEFGVRIGLPEGSAQAWASQERPVGADMVALVFAGENPQMVHNFVGTVRRHLGL